MANTYTDNDYDDLEDIWSNTVTGDTIDAKVDFDFGGGIKPVLKLINPRKVGDKAKQKEVLESYADIADELEKFDNKKLIKFNEKFKDSVRQTKVFGRNAIAKEFGNGKPGRDLPVALKPLHSRDLGRVFIRQLDWGLSSVQAFNKTSVLKDNEMIYTVNMAASPRRRAMHYGFSDIQRVMGESQALRKILEFDGPEIAETMWAGYGIVTVDTISKSPGGAKAELEVVRGGAKPGALNFISGKKDDINYQAFQMNPEIDGLIKMVNHYEKIIIGRSGIPGAFFGREEESNMATMFGKIRLMIAGPVKKDRDWLSRIATEQWYDPNLAILNPELAEIVTVEPEFEQIVLESWIDVVESLAKLRLIFPSLPEEELLELANLPELSDKLSGNGEVTPDMVKLAQMEKDFRDRNRKEFDDSLPGTLLYPKELPKDPLKPAKDL